MNLFELIGNVTIRTAEALTGLSNVENAATRTGNVMRSFSDGMMNVGQKMTAFVTLPLAGLAAYGVKYNATMQDLQTSFKVMLGSQEKAVAMTDKLIKMGASTPFDSKQLAEYTKMMLSFGYTEQNVLPIMGRLGDVSLGNNEKMSSLTRTMGQINSLGKLQGGDLNQLIGQGWNPLNEITKKTGETMEQVRDRMSKGKVTYKEVEDALVSVTSKGGTFYNGMAEGSKTFNGQLSTLKDTFDTFIGKVTKPIFDKLLAILPKVIEKLSNLGETFSKLSPKMQTNILIIGGLVASIGPLLIVLATLGKGLAFIVTGLGAISLPVVGVIAGIAALTAIIAAGIAIVLRYGNGFNEMKNKIKSALDNFKTTVIKIFNDVKTVIAPFWEKLKTEALPPLKKMCTEIEKFIGTMADQFKIFSATVMTIWKILWPYLKPVATEVLNAIVTIVKLVFNTIGNLFKAARQVMSGDWKGAWTTILSITGNVISSIIQIASTLGPRVVGFFAEMGSKIIGKLRGLSNDAVGAMASVASSMYRSGQNMMNSLYDGIISMINKVKSGASKIASAITGFFPSSPAKEGPLKNIPKWMPTMVNMMANDLSKGEDKIKKAVGKMAGNLSFGNKFNVSGISKNVSAGMVVLQVNDPKIFNQQDIDKFMNPVIKRLRQLGIGDVK